MDSKDLEQISLLLDAFKWLMGAFGFLILVAAKFVWSIYKSLNNIQTANGIRDEKINQLEKKHDNLHNFVYQKN